MAIVDAEVPFLAAAADTALAGVSGFRGRLVYRSTSGGWRSALFVIVVEVASTFAYFGLSANLITYMTGPLEHSNAAAAAAVNVWSGTASLMPLLGAFVADSWLGRYRSIILGCILYVVLEDPPSMLVASFYASLYLIAIARGIDKPCGVAFAADQFDPDHPRERVARSSLFNWWYFSIAIGMAAAIAVISYIQENVGWGIGFGMLCGIMLCSFFVFLFGSPTYRIYAPTPGNESPFTRLGCGLVALAKSSSFPFGAREDDLREEEEDEDAVTRSEEARTVLRLLLIWAACLAYGVVFAQIMTFFNKQGRTLDRRIFGGLVLPPAALQTFTPVSILVFVPLYDRVLVPALHSTTGNPTGLTLLQRVGTGMAVSLAAVCVAVLVEGSRLETAREHGLVDDARATVPMSWVWLVPQYVMVGVADVFAMIGMQEFFYDQMPSELRSLGLGLYYSVIGMGGFISGGLISLIDSITTSYGGDSWFADNLNHAHLDYFYWLLAAISAAELALFIRLASSYAFEALFGLLGIDWVWNGLKGIKSHLSQNPSQSPPNHFNPFPKWINRTWPERFNT